MHGQQNMKKKVLRVTMGHLDILLPFQDMFWWLGT